MDLPRDSGPVSPTRRQLARVLLLVAGALLVHQSLAAQAGSCRVGRIIDGDTLVCQGGERIRLTLVDSPERGQLPFGPRAKEFLTRLAPPGTNLTIELDVAERDRYRRLLAYLYLPDGRMINLVMVESGQRGTARGSPQR